MLPTSIFFCLRLFFLSSCTIPSQQCRQSSVFSASSLSFPHCPSPKLLAACHHDVIRARVPICCIVLKWIFLHQFFSELQASRHSQRVFSIPIVRRSVNLIVTLYYLTMYFVIPLLISLLYVCVCVCMYIYMYIICILCTVEYNR